MRTKKIILLLLLACIAGILFFFACRYTYASKLAEFRAKALNGFTEALNSEFISRNLQGNILINLNLATTKPGIPETVYWEDESGRHEYLLKPEKSLLNITSDTNIRSLHTIAFKKKPLQPDSLNAKWMEYIKLSNLFLKSGLRISLMNKDGSIKSQNKTSQSEWCNTSHEVFTRYIGYASEIEVVAYLSFSKWGIIYKEILIYLILCILLVFGSYKFIEFLDCKLRSMRSKEIIEVVKEVPVEIIKEVPVEIHVFEEVRKVDATNIHTYKLGEHLIFYADKNIVVADGVEKKMQAQSSFLLELFLNESKNGYVLKNIVIMEKLWIDGSGNNTRMLKAITRLRSFIRELDTSLEILRKVDAYQLIIPENKSID